MAEYYSSKEFKVTTTNSSDPPMETTYIRQEREISIQKTISLSQLFNRRDSTSTTATDADFKKDAAGNTTREMSSPPLSHDPQTQSGSKHPTTAAQNKGKEELYPENEEEEEEEEERGMLQSTLLEHQPPPETEDNAPQMIPEWEPKYPLEEQIVTHLPPMEETTLPEQTPEKEEEKQSGKGSDLDEEEEQSVPRPTPDTELPAPPLVMAPIWPNEFEEPPVMKATDPQPPLAMEPPGFEQLTPEKKPTASWVRAEKAGVSQPPLHRGPAKKQALPLIQELTVPQPAAGKETPFLLLLGNKSVAAIGKVSRRTAPSKPKILTSLQPEKETVIRTETTVWPKMEDSNTSLCEPECSASPQRERSFNDTMEEISSHLKQASSNSRTAMANSILSFVKSPVGQVFANTIERALEKSEEWMNYYLPLPETSVASVSTVKEGGSPSQDLCKEGCFMRISFLSTQLRNRAFRIILHQLKSTRQSTTQNLSLIDQILDLLDLCRPPSIQNVPEHLSNLWARWSTKHEAAGAKRPSRPVPMDSISFLPEQLEIKALSLTRLVAHELYDTYHNLLPHVGELPSHLQENVTRVYENLEELQSHLSTSASLRDLPANIIVQSRQKLASARENLDELLDFMAQKPPGQWLSQPGSSRGSKEPLFVAGSTQPMGETSENRSSEEDSASWQGPRPPPSPPRL